MLRRCRLFCKVKCHSSCLSFFLWPESGKFTYSWLRRPSSPSSSASFYIAFKDLPAIRAKQAFPGKCYVAKAAFHDMEGLAEYIQQQPARLNKSFHASSSLQVLLFFCYAKKHERVCVRG